MFDQRENQGLVQRLDPAHINHGRVDSVTRQYGLIQQNTKVENGNLGALAHDIAFADLQASQACIERDSRSFSSGITDGGGALVQPPAL